MKWCSKRLMTQRHCATKNPYVFRSGIRKFNDINPYGCEGKFVDDLWWQ